MPGPRRRYKFRIKEAYSPATLPLYRLAEYLTQLAALLGEPESVHFVKVEEGSAVLVEDIEHEAYPKVRDRVHRVKRHDGPADAERAYATLNKMLASDNATGELTEDAAPDMPTHEPAKVLDFPGRRAFVEVAYGPFNQAGTIQGVIILVGGEQDTVPVHVEDGRVVHICRAKRPLAKTLAQFLFGSPIRLVGMGRWMRDEQGQWIMKTFTITDYSPLGDDSLDDVVQTLRAVSKTRATRSANPLRDLEAIRKGEAS